MPEYTITLPESNRQLSDAEIDEAIERLTKEILEVSDDPERRALLISQRHNLERLREDRAILLRPEPASRGRIGGIEI
jgi:hypothetical protein